MIFDDFKNIDLYEIISPEIKNFILNVDPDIKEGKHVISNRAYVNIDVYKTRKKETLKLEAHREYIDIQFLIKGKERVFTLNNEILEVLEKYDKGRDIEFYKTPDLPLNVSYLKEGKFIMLFPDDIHAPCIEYDNEPEEVKKAIIKIKL